MAVPNPQQLFLLADHLKLSILERQRAISLNLDSHKQDAQITRSLRNFRKGLDALEQSSDSSSSIDPSDLLRLQNQYNTLNAQFNPSSANPTTNPTNLTTPNDPSLQPDFAAAQKLPAKQTHPGASRTTSALNRNVRFRDDPTAENEPRYTDADAQELDLEDEANRAALFGDSPSNNHNQTSQRYRDDPPAQDHSSHSNEQIHAYHSQVLRDQDSQLDVLGQSIQRQRMLGIEMGNELDLQVDMLDDVERGVDRHTTTLEGARRRLGDFARKSKQNWSWVTIAILICILLLVIIVLK